jgi:hypothetical protein
MDGCVRSFDNSFKFVDETLDIIIHSCLLGAFLWRQVKQLSGFLFLSGNELVDTGFNLLFFGLLGWSEALSGSIS